MNALEFWDDGSGNHFYFCQFANAASLPPELLTFETSHPRKRGSRASLGQLWRWECRHLEIFGDRKLGPSLGARLNKD
jgi:hypothetical protein